MNFVGKNFFCPSKAQPLNVCFSDLIFVTGWLLFRGWVSRFFVAVQRNFVGQLSVTSEQSKRDSWNVEPAPTTMQTVTDMFFHSPVPVPSTESNLIVERLRLPQKTRIGIHVSLSCTSVVPESILLCRSCKPAIIVHPACGLYHKQLHRFWFAQALLKLLPYQQTQNSIHQNPTAEWIARNFAGRDNPLERQTRICTHNYWWHAWRCARAEGMLLSRVAIKWLQLTGMPFCLRQFQFLGLSRAHRTGMATRLFRELWGIQPP